MGTIFVAYGGSRRKLILEAAVDRAATDSHDLLICQIQEEPSDPVDRVRDEVETVVGQIDPHTALEIEVAETSDGEGDRSVQARLLEAINQRDRSFEYVVMGDIDRGSIEKFTHSSLTEAVLNDGTYPVLLVPV